jgi:hypothetical protein
MRLTVLISATVLGLAGCSTVGVVDTGESPAAAPTNTATQPPLPPVNNAHLVDAFDYVSHPSGEAGYYFTTPSGRWQCAILPRAMAGCQSSGGNLGIAGEPDTVPNAAGEDTTPNAIIIEPEGDTRFAALDEPGFTLIPGPANALEFNRTLIAARFRCNVQEAIGVSCLSEQSGKGFTFNEEGFAPQYTEVPVDAP